MKQITYNKYATYEYFILEKYEAGIVLEGAEVKSLRAGNCNLKDSFCFIRSGQLTLKTHILQFTIRRAHFPQRKANATESF